MHPGAEIASPSRYGREPFEDVALVGSRLYLEVMRAMLAGFREMGAVTPDVVVTEINGPIGTMSRHLRAWVNGWPPIGGGRP